MLGGPNDGIRVDALNRGLEEGEEGFTDTITTGTLQDVSNLSRQRSPRASKPRNIKKPRFSTISTREWSKDDENKYVDLPERNLSPQQESPAILPDSRDTGLQDDTSEYERFPTAADLCRTPESTGGRDSISSEFARAAPEIGRISSSGEPGLLDSSSVSMSLTTPERQRDSGSSMAVSMPRTDCSMPYSLDGSTPMQDGEVTSDVLPLARLVNEDEEQDVRGYMDVDMAIPTGGIAHSPARSEASVGDWGVHWDLYHKFKSSQEDASDEEYTAPQSISHRQAPETLGTLDAATLVSGDKETARSCDHAVGSQDSRPGSPERQEAQVPRSMAASPTVDMSHIKERLGGPHGTARSSHGSESEVPEGRKSFSSHVPLCADRQETYSAPLSATDELVHSGQGIGYTDRLSASPSSRRSSGIDFEKINQEWDQKRENRGLGLATASIPQSVDTSIATSSTSKAKNAGFAKSGPGYGLIAGVGGSASARMAPTKQKMSIADEVATEPSPPGKVAVVPSQDAFAGGLPLAASSSLFGASTQHADSSFGDKMQVDTTLTEDSGQLQCESEFRTLSGESEFSHPAVRTRVSWDEFLEGCGISFPNLESQVPQTESSFVSSSASTFEFSHTQRAPDALQQERAICLQKFTEKLQQQIDDLRREYSVNKGLWDQSKNMPQIAIEQIQSKRSIREEEHFNSRMKDFHTRCKDQAWLHWYALKHEWLSEDLELTKHHTNELQAEAARCNEQNRRLTELSKDIQDALSRVQDKGDTVDTRDAFQSTSRHELRSTQQDLQVIQQNMYQARTELENERRATADLNRRIGEMNRQKAEAETRLKEAERRTLEAKLRKVILEKQRLAHTCIMKEADAFGVVFSLRGGARVRVESSAPSDVVSVSLESPPANQNSDPHIALPPRLSFGLLVNAWWQYLASVHITPQSASSGSSLKASVPGKEVARMMRHLDVNALHIWDFLRSIRGLRKPLPEVTQVSGELTGDGGHTLMLSFELSVVRSHDVSAAGYVTPKDTRNPFDVDASQCSLKIKADIRTFPDFEWSVPVIEPILGPLNSEALMRAMHGTAGIREMLAAAIQVMRRTGPRR